MRVLAPALEDDEVGVAGPHHVRIVRGLLHVGRPKAVLSLEKIPGERLDETIQH